MNPTAFVVGEALVDEVHEGDHVSRRPGGSPANVALGLARLGLSVRLHTAIGDDVDGRFIRGWLAASGVDVTASSITAETTSVASVSLAADGSASYAFKLQWNPAPLGNFGAQGFLHVGSLGAFLLPGAELTMASVEYANNTGTAVSLDPNIRPFLLSDPVETRKRFEQLATRSQLVKMSDEDASYLYPDLPLEAVLARLLAGGASIAAITLGARGALIASGNHRVRIPAVPASIVDTVGAGDSFMAALLWALTSTPDRWNALTVSPDRLASIGSLAARAAAITTSRRGADLPYREDLAVELEDA